MRKVDVVAGMRVIIDDPDLTTTHKIDNIFRLIGKLSPEPGSGNLKREVPNYNKHLVKKVGRRRIETTPEQRAIARRILREMGMI